MVNHQRWTTVLVTLVMVAVSWSPFLMSDETRLAEESTTIAGPTTVEHTFATPGTYTTTVEVQDTAEGRSGGDEVVFEHPQNP